MTGSAHTSTSVQERLEASTGGRLLVSALLVVTLTGVVVSNLPRSGLTRPVAAAVKPFTAVTGISQSGWRLFAPDPPRRSRELSARIVYADGSADVWRTPHGGAALDAYESYRWRKWSARVLTTRSLHEVTARWLLEEHDHKGRTPVRVELVRRWRDLPPPGADGAAGPWKARAIYTLNLEEGLS